MTRTLERHPSQRADAGWAPLVVKYDRVDDTVIKTTTDIQAGFIDPDEDRVVQDTLPSDLHTKVVYENWLRGEFGSPDSPQAKEFGRQLLDAQAWTVDDVRRLRDSDNGLEQSKKDHYKQIAGQLGPATGYFNGTEGSRFGAALLALLQAMAYSLFQLLAKVAVVLAQLLLRILTLAAPVIGLVALVHHDILRKAGTALGAIVLNVLVLATLAGVHFRLLELTFSDQAKLSLLTQLLIAGITTVTLLRLGRPIQRIQQMIKQSVRAAVPAAIGIGQGNGTPSSGRITTGAESERIPPAATRTSPGSAQSRIRRPRPEAVAIAEGAMPVISGGASEGTVDRVGGKPGESPQHDQGSDGVVGGAGSTVRPLSANEREQFLAYRDWLAAAGRTGPVKESLAQPVVAFDLDGLVGRDSCRACAVDVV